MTDSRRDDDDDDDKESSIDREGGTDGQWCSAPPLL